MLIPLNLFTLILTTATLTTASSPAVKHFHHTQKPLAMPSSPPTAAGANLLHEALQSDRPTGPPLLSDVLPLDKSISIFAGLTRSVESIQTRLGSSSLNTTILAPGNAAVAKLPRKPWEDPEDGAGVMGEDKAGENLRRFVEEHCVDGKGWQEGERRKTLGGKEVWWQSVEGGRRVYPDDVEVVRVQGEVANGELWVVDGVLNYST